MRRMVGLSLLLCCSPAYAAPGDHIRVGSAEITPAVRTGFEYHSNVYQHDAEDNAPSIAAPFWFIRPSAEVKLDGPWVVLSVTAGYSIRVYIDTVPKDEYDVGKLNRFNDFDITTNAQFLPNRRVGFKLADRLMIQDTPTDLHGDGVKSDLISVVHTSNALDAGAVIRPGSALDINVLGNFSVDLYHIPDEYVDSYPDVLVTPENGFLNNRLSGGPIASGVWRFLPKTSLTGNFSVIWNHWNANLIPSWASGADGYVGDVVAKPNGMAWRTSWGVKGQVSSRFAASAEVGFGEMFYNEDSVTDYNSSLPAGFAASSFELELRGGENAENYARDLTSFREGLLLNLQGSFTPVVGQTVTLSYKKDFQDVLFSNYSAYNAVAFKYEGQWLNKRLGTTLEYSTRLDRYHGEIVRGDFSHRLRAETSWLFTRYLGASVSGGWSARYCADTGCADPFNPDVTFTQVQYDDLWIQGAATFTY